MLIARENVSSSVDSGQLFILEVLATVGYDPRFDSKIEALIQVLIMSSK